MAQEGRLRQRARVWHQGRGQCADASLSISDVTRWCRVMRVPRALSLPLLLLRSPPSHRLPVSCFSTSHPPSCCMMPRPRRRPPRQGNTTGRTRAGRTARTTVTCTHARTRPCTPSARHPPICSSCQGCVGCRRRLSVWARPGGRLISVRGARRPSVGYSRTQHVVAQRRLEWNVKNTTKRRRVATCTHDSAWNT